MTCGIYQILNILTGKCYVGQSKSIEDRWGKHRQHLKGNGHHSIKLQRAWNKYGPDVWKWNILQEDIKDRLDWLEAFWQARMNSYHNGYDSILLLLENDKIIKRFSEETRRKRSFAFKGRVWSEETRAKHLGQKRTKEQKAKMSLAQKGKILSLETREKMRLSQQIRFSSEENRVNLSNVLKGKPKSIRSKEHSKNISKANKGKKMSEEFIAKQKARKCSLETRKKMSKPCTEERKEKLRKPCTEERKEKLRESWILRKLKETG